MALLSVPLFIATDLILCRRAITHGLLCLDMLTLAYVLVRVHVDCILCNTASSCFVSMVISYSVFTYLKSVDLYPVSLVYTQTAGIIFARYKMTAGIHLKFR